MRRNTFPSTTKESPMTTMTSKCAGSTASTLQKLAVLAAALVLAGCTVTPQLATQEEVRGRVTADTALMYVNQAPINGPVTMEEAVARSLKYNLDYRLKKMESALSLGLADYASYDMLPNLLATAGYRTRSNDSGGTSIGILDGVQSLRPSTSEERRHTLAGAGFPITAPGNNPTSTWLPRSGGARWCKTWCRTFVQPTGARWAPSVCRRKLKISLSVQTWRLPDRAKLKPSA
jgi:hypothetical protein